jgi:hypothetical protein
LSGVLGGTNPGDFTIAGGTCGSTLTAKSSCTFAVSFNPTATGSRSASLTITDSPDPNSPHSISLAGTGLVPVTVSVTNVAFGSVKGGNTSTAKTVTVTNKQAGAISLSGAIGGTNAGDFAITAASTCGSSLAANSSCKYSLTFAPSAKGSRSGSLTITDHPDPNSPYSVALTGTGT